MTIILFLAVLFVLILVHEWGHFIVAKKTGMRVDEFGIGFPPKLFGLKRGETEYTFNLLPIGGFVRIWGENYDEEFSPVVSEANDRRSEASAEAGEGGAKVDYSRAFGARPKWAQSLVLIAGVTMNVLFAWFLISVALMIGVPTALDGTEQSQDASLMVTSVVSESPAAEARIPIGATVLSLSSGEEILELPTPDAFSEFVVAHPSEPVEVTYTKDGNEMVATMEPIVGLVSDDETRPAVGVSLSYVETVSEPIHRALYLGAIQTADAAVAITKGLSGLLVQMVRGDADYSQVAGPIGIAGYVGDAAQFGITSLMLFTAMISLNLAVINLLPIPALDGGRLLFVAIEAVTKKDIPAVWAMRVNMVGFVCLMLLMLLVTYSDIIKLL